MSEATFSAPHVIEYDYKRSVGTVLGRFFTELRDGRLVGSKTSDGRVLVPPQEFDPETGESISELVPVGPGGTVTTWAWVAAPRAVHPLDRPFAFALIQMDGATSAILHAVDAGDESRMETGMRVTPRWKSERSGSILDVACFEPEEAA